MGQGASVPARAWVVTGAGMTVNLCLGILYAWSVWKANLVAPQGTAPGTPFGIPGGGRRLSFRLLHIFDMAPDGKIRRENVWLDFAAILQQLGAPQAQ